jgi:hypothetical protein
MPKKLWAEMFDEGAVVLTCFVCSGSFQHGPHRYGQFIVRYQITVCSPCFRVAWDGWAPHAGEKIARQLDKGSIPIPPRNASGLLPRE